MPDIDTKEEMVVEIFKESISDNNYKKVLIITAILGIIILGVVALIGYFKIVDVDVDVKKQEAAK